MIGLKKKASITNLEGQMIPLPPPKTMWTSYSWIANRCFDNSKITYSFVKLTAQLSSRYGRRLKDSLYHICT